LARNSIGSRRYSPETSQALRPPVLAAMTAADAKSAPAAAEPQKPKRAQSAYFLFTNAMREEVTKGLKEKSEEGKFKFGDVAKEISSRWSSLPESEKKVYEDKAAADKQRFEEEFRVYQEASDMAGALRKKYAHLMPKRAATAAARFLQDAAVREKAAKELKPDAGAKEVDAKVREMWKAAGEEERKPYEEQAAKEKAEFFKQQTAWQATPEFAEIEKAEKEQEEREKAAGGAEEKAKEESEPKKRGKKAGASKSPAKETPTKGGGEAKKDTAGKTSATKAKPAKRAQDKENAPPPEAKRAKKSIAPGMMLEATAVAEAAKLGMESALRNLAARPDVAASSKSSADLLAALKASGGLVNPAKRALLGL